MVKLNIAFFGSDKFSVYSLSRLIQLQRRNPSLISSIDLITRPPKRFRKQIVDVPILEAYPDLMIHRADNKNDILKLLDTKSFNLAVAVSYGKLIPSLFVESMKYGGLNVHPSSLPKYSGASPIQFALLNDDTETGVSVQTLHPTKFDGGDVLIQQNGISIGETDDYSSLVQKLGPIGGEILAKTIEEELFINPSPISTTEKFSYAPKLRTEDHEVIWDKYDARHIFKRFCAMGPLYTYLFCDVYSKQQKRNLRSFKRVILDDIQFHNYKEGNSREPGSFYLNEETKKLMIKDNGNSAISVGKILMETFKQESPLQFMTSLKKRTGFDTTNFTTNTSTK